MMIEEHKAEKVYLKSSNKSLQNRKVESKQKSDVKEKFKRDIFCKLCLNKITSHSEEIFIDGSFSFEFINPHNIRFTIGCFANTSGCIIQGVPTDIATWFPGYTWSLVACRKCSEHLGWYFQKVSDSFYGLILAKLDGDI